MSGPNPLERRTYPGDHSLEVYDGVAPSAAVAALYRHAVDRAHWSFSNQGTAEDELTSFAADLMNYDLRLNEAQRVARWSELGEQMPHLHELWGTVEAIAPGRHQLQRVFLNGHTFALGDAIHCDDFDRTFLVYLNPVWKAKWAGETIFYDEQVRDIRAAVLPKPGRVVCFDGRVPHAGRAPSRLFTELRVTLAIQTTLVEAAA